MASTITSTKVFSLELKASRVEFLISHDNQVFDVDDQPAQVEHFHKMGKQWVLCGVEGVTAGKAREMYRGLLSKGYRKAK